MDSRDYISAFLINAVADVPGDFESLPEIPDLIAGLFLPQSELDWLRRRAHPARVLLLTSGALWVIPHSQSKDQRLRIPLRDLQILECGRILLLGWIGLRWGDLQQRLSYNRRGSPAVEKFLTRLKARWLTDTGNQTKIEAPSHGDYGAVLTGKFKHALATEMIDDVERPLIRFFHPSIRRVRRRFFRYETWSAGDLIAVSQRRVLWITERRATMFEPYGTVSYSAPLAELLDVDCCPVERGLQLRVRLRSGQSWQFPFENSDEADAQSFAHAIRTALSGSSGDEPLSMPSTGSALPHRSCEEDSEHNSASNET